MNKKLIIKSIIHLASFLAFSMLITSVHAAGFVFENQQVYEKSLASYITNDWVELDTNEAKKLSLLGIAIETNNDSKVLLGTSSQFIFVLCLNGNFNVNDEEVIAGELFLTGHDGFSSFRIVAYDAERLQNSLRLGGRDDLAVMLDPIIISQNRLKFWGLLRTSYFNVATPVIPQIEKIRKTYLNQVDILAARRNGQNHDEIKLNVIDGFVKAVQSKNNTSVSAYLNPQYFIENSKASKIQEWKVMRHDFSTTLVNDLDLTGATVEKSNVKNEFFIKTNINNYRLKTSLYDTAVFIDSITEE